MLLLFTTHWQKELLPKEDVKTFRKIYSYLRASSTRDVRCADMANLYTGICVLRHGTFGKA